MIILKKIQETCTFSNELEDNASYFIMLKILEYLWFRILIYPISMIHIQYIQTSSAFFGYT